MPARNRRLVVGAAADASDRAGSTGNRLRQSLLFRLFFQLFDRLAGGQVLAGQAGKVRAIPVGAEERGTAWRAGEEAAGWPGTGSAAWSRAASFARGAAGAGRAAARGVVPHALELLSLVVLQRFLEPRVDVVLEI